MAIVLNGATSGNVTIDANAISGTSIITLPVGSGTFPLMTLSTAVATTSGTAIDYTGIPSWVKRITVILNGVSTNGTSSYMVQLGDSGGVETTGYVAIGGQTYTTGSGSLTSTAGFPLGFNNTASFTQYGSYIFNTLGANTWIGSGTGGTVTGAFLFSLGGSKTLSDTLTQIRITTVNGTDTFDAGSVNILMEGY